MRTLLLATLVGASLATGYVTAAEHQTTKPGTEGVAPHDMRGFDERRMQMHNDEMELHLKEMQALMDKMHATRDAKERRRMLEEHRADMRALMKSMHSTRDEMVMGMMGGGPRGGATMPEGEKRRQHLIEKRLDMMDNAMEMMMRRDEMMMKH